MLPLAVSFIDIPMGALFSRIRSAAGSCAVRRRGAPNLTDSLPGQRVEIARLTGVTPQAVVKLSLWWTTARLRNKTPITNSPGKSLTGILSVEESLARMKRN